MPNSHWEQLDGCAVGLALANLRDQSDLPIVVIAPTIEQAHQLETELHTFLPEKAATILNFPHWETLPYDHFSPHQDIISERLQVLATLPKQKNAILVVAMSTLMHRLPPKDYIEAFSFLLKKTDTLDVQVFRQQLIKCGYHSVEQVMQHGEFCVRGSLIDVFPMGSSHPIRIDRFDDEIDSLRVFDPETQISISEIDQLKLLPAHEVPIDEQGIAHFRTAWREQFDLPAGDCPIYESVSEGQLPAGIEYYLPLFFDETASLFDYVPNAIVVSLGNLESAGKQFNNEIQERYEQLRHDIERPILPPAELFFTPEAIFTQANKHSRIKVKTVENTLPDIALTIHDKVPHAKLERFLIEFPGRILFCAQSAGRQEILLEQLQQFSLQATPVGNWHSFLTHKDKICMTVAPIDRGALLTDPSIAIITEPQLYGEQALQSRRRKTAKQDPDTLIHSLAELQIGSPVVHQEYGVGRYKGLQKLAINGIDNEFLMLTYANEDKIYVPVASLHLISRYSGTDADSAPLNKLGSEQWARAKNKAKAKIRDAAAELLDLYAKRNARAGFNFSVPDNQYTLFSEQFPFEVTADQQKAINDVIADMTNEKPMDRLICGDVGFGKTEVAMRAAFLAIQSGKQVAVLVPTTLLAQQHFQTFQERFANWPVNVAQLSRFVTPGEQKKTIAALANGQVDIVIATHRLLQKDIKFKQLGLVVIDEEHRFGVGQKEKLKKLRENVDILALTATPIPRTLNMALSTIRDLSIIATPPAKRLSIKTFIFERSNTVIREAVMRELMRGGQIYFLHNKVQSIQRVTDELAELLPEAKIAIAHGQMPESQLEKVMLDFYHRRCNILVCTTIIETGIDIPNANTIIMDKADHFGLAQLHQLRGRVGRSHHQAYAYLMVNNKKAITNDAKKRLDAIESLGELGIGFTLATHDLEIRGAGELLGEEQSGNMQAIGFSLYMDLLERAVQALQRGENVEQSLEANNGPEINLQISALLPEEYIADVYTRLQCYKRVSSAVDTKALDNLRVEFIDRFGLLPESAKNLFQVSELRQTATKLGIQAIDWSKTGGTIDFSEKTPVGPDIIISLIQKQPNRYRLAGERRLKVALETENANQRLAAVIETLTVIASA